MKKPDNPFHFNPEAIKARRLPLKPSKTTDQQRIAKLMDPKISAFLSHVNKNKNK